MARSTAQFEPLVAKAIARQCAKRRVALVGAPHVGRQGADQPRDTLGRGAIAEEVRGERPQTAPLPAP